MSTYALTSEGDLDLVGGRLVRVTGADAAAVTLRNKLRLFLGEWFRDIRLGIPYYQVVFVKNPNLNQIRAMFRRVILGTAPIAAVDTLTLGPIAPDRSCPFNFKALCDDGATITGGADQPFIVEP